MKRLLVVDDEPPVLDHLVRLLGRDLADLVQVVGTASSGREALEQVAALSPDILIMDVRMPGLSGLDTIRELNRRGSAPVTVLSTAYERFDIVREALDLGVVAYLLKPVVREDLAAAVRRAADEVDHRLEAAPAAGGREEDAEVRAFVARSFFTSLMLGQDPGPAGEVWGPWLGIDKPYGLVVAAAWDQPAAEAHSRLETLLHYKSPALCGPLVGGRCLILYPLAAPEDAAAARRALDALVGVPGLRLGYAEPQPLASLDRGWAQALAAVLGAVSPSGAPSSWAPEADQDFLSALLEGDRGRALEVFEALVLGWDKPGAVAPAQTYRLISLLGGALVRLAAAGRIPGDTLGRLLDMGDLNAAATARALVTLARSRLPVLFEAAGRQRRGSAAVAEALDLIHQHFGQTLSLEIAADLIGLPPKRLSRLFVDEVGQGFSEVLIEVRIERAKRLLEVPGATIKQVSADCGYSDPNYFARLFKKVTGSTPSEYQHGRGL